MQGEGAWRRLAMYPDNFTYLSVIGRISVQGEGAWQRRLQTRTRVQAHQWAANYFLVRMVVPGTKPVENPCSEELLITHEQHSKLSSITHAQHSKECTTL